VQKLTCLDYVMMIGLAAANDRHAQLLAEYFCEMALQYSDLSIYTQGHLAASCVLLARLTMGIGQSECECQYLCAFDFLYVFVE